MHASDWCRLEQYRFEYVDFVPRKRQEQLVVHEKEVVALSQLETLASKLHGKAHLVEAAAEVVEEDSFRWEAFLTR
jgi:hypothetical protein